jgi:hypothetical protein
MSEHEQERDRADEAALVERDVDQHPGAHQATEPDEEQTLTELYGEPEDGIFSGEEASR